MNQEKVVVVYSMSDKAYAYAEKLAQDEGCVCVRVVTKHQPNWLGYMHLGYLATFKKPVRYQKIDYDFSKTKHMIVVAPIHASRVCAPIRSFLFQHRSFLSQVDLILTHSAQANDYLQAAKEIEKELIFKFSSVKSITL